MEKRFANVLKKSCFFLAIMCLVFAFSVVLPSASYASSFLNPSDVATDWVGEYDGHSGSVVVRRSYAIHITNVGTDGEVVGTAEISPSDKADAAYGASGSYDFAGSIDFETGKFTMQGNHWIVYPEVTSTTSSWTFVKLSGAINAANGSISGTTENGIWAMSAGTYEDENKALQMYDSVTDASAETTAKWSDRWFALSANAYNHDLATTASVLSSAVYKKAVLEKDYEALNFHDAEYHDHSGKNMGDDKVAFSFAVHNASFGSEDFPVVAVMIRGTANGAEWLSNVNISNEAKTAEDYHEGFDTAATEVVATLSAYLKKENLDASKARFLVTGHSRGASVANLVGYKLDSGEIDNVSQTNVYDYTFAAPNVATKSDVSSTSYSNIYNIVNPEDVVARVPLALWGYGKYGKTLYLPSRSNILISDYAEQKSLMQERYGKYAQGDEYSSYATGTLRTIALTSSLAGVSPTVWCYYNLPLFSTNVFASTTLNDIVSSVWKKNWQTAVSKAVQIPACWNLALSILGQEVVEASLSTTKLNKLAARDGDVVKWLLPEVQDGHRQATYVAWMQSGDYATLFKQYYYGISIACPVNVYAYDSQGNLVASIENNKVNENISNAGLAAYVDGETKCIDFPAGSSYTVKVVPTAEGTMDVAWRLRNDDGSLVSQTCYNDVTLSEGADYSLNLSTSSTTNTNGMVTMRDADGEIVYPSYTTRGASVGTLSVDVETVGDGNATCVPEATKGDQVKVTATATDGARFQGWFENGELICSEATYAFRIEESRKLTAKFTESKSLSGAVVKGLKDSYAYKAKGVKPSFNVVFKGVVLKKGRDYSVSYNANKKAGKATATIKGKGVYTGKQSVSFVVKPPKVTGVKVVRGGRGKLKVKWSNAKSRKAAVVGYVISYKISGKAKKTVFVPGKKTAAKTISKLGCKKHVNVRVTGYTIVDGQKIMGAWSKNVKARTK